MACPGPDRQGLPMGKMRSQRQDHHKLNIEIDGDIQTSFVFGHSSSSYGDKV